MKDVWALARQAAQESGGTAREWYGVIYRKEVHKEYRARGLKVIYNKDFAIPSAISDAHVFIQNLRTNLERARNGVGHKYTSGKPQKPSSDLLYMLNEAIEKYGEEEVYKSIKESGYSPHEFEDKIAHMSQAMYDPYYASWADGHQGYSHYVSDLQRVASALRVVAQNSL